MTEQSPKDLIKAALDEQVDCMDIATQVKLNELRHGVIFNQQQKPSRKLKTIFVGAGFMGALALMIMLLIPAQNTSTGADAVMFEDLELLANEADTDFYQDIEFLTWLDENNLIESEI